MLNVDQILAAFQKSQVAFLLIGGVNFLLRHAPHVTFDIDLWIEDTAENRRRCEAALADLNAEWGPTDAEWGPVSRKGPGWLDRQFVYCLTSPQGAIDIFRAVRGLGEWRSSWATSLPMRTAAGIDFAGLGDEDMLRCQLALDATQQKPARVAILREAIALRRGDDGK